MPRILIHGALGKAGRMLAEAAAENDALVAAGVDRFAAGQTLPFPLFDSLDACDVKADVLIDFSTASALEGVLAYGLATKTPLVIATTGFTPEQHKAIDEAARTLPIFQCANMSLGVNVMVDVLRTCAVALDKFDIEIIEKHHNTKLDAPSGTAVMLADELARLHPADAHFVYGRQGKALRNRGDIGIHALRGGTVVGEHEVLFMGPDEVLSVKHTAASRRIFVLGALKAAQYLLKKRPGRYTMKDMLTEELAVQAMYVQKEQAMLSVRGVPHMPRAAAALFQALGKAAVNVDMISQTAPQDGHVDVSFSLPSADMDKACAALGALPAGSYASLSRQSDLVKLTVEGPGMERQPGIAGRVFDRLASRQVVPFLVTTSETKIAVCLPAAQESGAVSALKDAFGL